MSSKKKKVYLLFLPLWMVVLCFFAYQIGYKKGMQDSGGGVFTSLSKMGDGSGDNPKVERLTFFNTLHQPPQIPHEMIEPGHVATKDSYVPHKSKPTKTSVEAVVAQELKKHELPQEVAPPKTDTVVALVKKEMVGIEKNKEKQMVRIDKKEFTLDKIKRLPWAVQVGAFSDGVQAVLLQKELQKKGYPAFTAVSASSLVRVYVGGASQNQSHKLKKDLENNGYLKAFVVKRTQ